MKMKIENHIKNGDEHLVSGLPMQMGTSQDREIEKTSKRNKERCAAFIAKLIEKYGREVLAEIERENITDQFMAGKTRKILDGKWSGGAVPYGYRSENKELVLVPDKAKIVRKIYEIYELRRIIRKETKKEFMEKVTELEGYQKTQSGLKKMEEAKEYILSNWTAAKIRLKHKDGLLGCSAEGHVSHVLSDRMSSRPMGWSVKGAANMVQLRAYERNGGDMLELIRFQNRELPKAAGAEYEVISAKQMLMNEKSRHGELGKYVNAISHSISLDTKKKVYFQAHLWGL